MWRCSFNAVSMGLLQRYSLNNHIHKIILNIIFIIINQLFLIFSDFFLRYNVSKIRYTRNVRYFYTTTVGKLLLYLHNVKKKNYIHYYTSINLNKVRVHNLLMQ